MSGLLISPVLMTFMVSSFLAAAPICRATTSIGAQRLTLRLTNMVPRQLGEWRGETGMALVKGDPKKQALSDRGASSVILPTGYGKHQSNTLQVHKPEVSHPAQNLWVNKAERVTLDLPDRSIAEFECHQ